MWGRHIDGNDNSEFRQSLNYLDYRLDLHRLPPLKQGFEKFDHRQMIQVFTATNDLNLLALFPLQ
jgi:hypothetical protein